ncbi:MAG: hypothetical protein ACXAAH_11560 [Promethearchaeota archaeon]|jgi:50S ribosomal subunit-associated GTPase HflX
MDAIEQVIVIENILKDLNIHDKDLFMLQNKLDTLKDQLHEDNELKKFLALGDR